MLRFSLKNLGFLALLSFSTWSLQAQEISLSKPENRFLGIGSQLGTQLAFSSFIYNFQINLNYSYVQTQRLGLTVDFFHPSFYISFGSGIFLTLGTGLYLDYLFQSVLGEISPLNVGLGLRFPIQVIWYVVPQSTELFLETALGVAFLPRVGFYYQITVGSRYYFNMSKKDDEDEFVSSYFGDSPQGE